MIQTERLYRDLMSTAKLGTAGYIGQDEVNDAIAAVQTALMSMLAPLYATERSVKDLLAPFVKKVIQSNAGTIDKPADYEQIIGINVGDYPATEVDLNEISAINQIPSRRGNASRGVYTYIEEEDKFIVSPAGNCTLYYIKRPVAASITLNSVSTEDSDYTEISSSVNLEWPEKAYNLIFYMMLDRFGINQKEALLLEYSKYGIQQEAAKL